MRPLLALDRVLLATDFSPPSEAALARACALLGTSGALHLLHVLPEASARSVESILGEAHGRLHEVATRVRSAGVTVDVQVGRGRAVETVISIAEERRAHLIVVGTHAREGIERLTIGSVAEEIARVSPIPTLVVREETVEIAAFQRVLLAVDHDPTCRGAAFVALALARRAGAPLEAVHVIQMPSAPYYAVDMPPLGVTDLTAGTLGDLRCGMAEELAALLGEAVPVKTIAGTPATEIVREARRTDLLVCGTHGRGILGRLAFGSVASKVLRRAPCPTLVVRSLETDGEREAA